MTACSSKVRDIFSAHLVEAGRYLTELASYERRSIATCSKAYRITCCASSSSGAAMLQPPLPAFSMITESRKQRLLLL